MAKKETKQTKEWKGNVRNCCWGAGGLSSVTSSRPDCSRPLLWQKKKKDVVLTAGFWQAGRQKRGWEGREKSMWPNIYEPKARCMQGCKESLACQIRTIGIVPITGGLKNILVHIQSFLILTHSECVSLLPVGVLRALQWTLYTDVPIIKMPISLKQQIHPWKYTGPKSTAWVTRIYSLLCIYWLRLQFWKTSKKDVW